MLSYANVYKLNVFSIFLGVRGVVGLGFELAKQALY
jgi:hypothetical protein